MSNLILASGIIGLPIASLSENTKIAHAHDVLIDAETGAFLGITIKKTPFSAIRILACRDIISIDKNGIVTKTSENIIPISEVVRAKKAKKFNMIGAKVKTKDGKYLGKVDDVAISLDAQMVVSLYVHLLWKERIISTDKITKIENKKIIIDSDWEVCHGTV